MRSGNFFPLCFRRLRFFFFVVPHALFCFCWDPPTGINLPNYDSVRQKHGYKNVSLDNILTSSFKSTKPVSFLDEEDERIYREYGKKVANPSLKHTLPPPSPPHALSISLLSSLSAAPSPPPSGSLLND